jgi:NAD-dependent SIR2 family protein deacetylase
MATYHGLIKVSCLVCNWESTEDLEIEIMNDRGDACPKCEEQFLRWENQNGSIVVSLTQNFDGLHTYDNLVWNQARTVEELEGDN